MDVCNKYIYIYVHTCMRIYIYIWSTVHGCSWDSWTNITRRGSPFWPIMVHRFIYYGLSSPINQVKVPITEPINHGTLEKRIIWLQVMQKKGTKLQGRQWNKSPTCSSSGKLYGLCSLVDAAYKPTNISWGHHFVGPFDGMCMMISDDFNKTTLGCSKKKWKKKQSTSTGWWFGPPWKILVRSSQLLGKIENVPNHQPVNHAFVLSIV